MRNVTVSLDDELVRRAKVEAARRDISLSKFVASMLEEKLCADEDAYEAARKRFYSRPLRPLRDPVKALPKREELYDRPRVR